MKWVRYQQKSSSQDALDHLSSGLCQLVLLTSSDQPVGHCVRASSEANPNTKNCAYPRSSLPSSRDRPGNTIGFCSKKWLNSGTSCSRCRKARIVPSFDHVGAPAAMAESPKRMTSLSTATCPFSGAPPKPITAGWLSPSLKPTERMRLRTILRQEPSAYNAHDPSLYWGGRYPEF